MATNPRSVVPAQQQKIEARLQKAPYCQLFHVDGAIGGVSPQGHIYVAFYSQTATLPNRTLIADVTRHQVVGTTSQQLVRVPTPRHPPQQGTLTGAYMPSQALSFSSPNPPKDAWHIPQDIERLHRRKFEALVADWETGRPHGVSALEMAMHPAYLQIIGMGETAVPLILRQLERKPDHWFIALGAITQNTPVPRRDIGKLKAMTSAWLAWGKMHGYSW